MRRFVLFFFLFYFVFVFLFFSWNRLFRIYIEAKPKKENVVCVSVWDKDCVFAWVWKMPATVWTRCVSWVLERERETHVYVWSCDRLLRIITFTCSFNRTVWLCSSLRKSEVTSNQNQQGYWRGWQNKRLVNSLELHVGVRLLFSVFSCADSSCVSLGGVRCLYYLHGWLQLSGMGLFVSVLIFHLPLQFLWT